QRLDFLAAREQPQRIAQPLNDGTGRKDRAFDGEGDAPANAPGDRADQLAAGAHQALTGIGHQKRAGTEGALGITGTQTGLTEQSSLLIARDAADGQRLAVHDRIGPTEVPGAVAHLRQAARRYGE